ncbi:sh3 domain containing protein [Fonsecaea nubica]|uniref:Sh3 domain containing protein n=1 Tax=Fonsecaea nubica TaxID=856822 RepID=A0A178DGR4_9EURO|nr:sh3 domain containing protein [Fonsecaea nubica]OAL40245.1 sh3 domain containing protein [Fonsecaea nubica]
MAFAADNAQLKGMFPDLPSRSSSRSSQSTSIPTVAVTPTYKATFNTSWIVPPGTSNHESSSTDQHGATKVSDRGPPSLGHEEKRRNSPTLAAPAGIPRLPPSELGPGASDPDPASSEILRQVPVSPSRAESVVPLPNLVEISSTQTPQANDHATADGKNGEKRSSKRFRDIFIPSGNDAGRVTPTTSASTPTTPRYKAIFSKHIFSSEPHEAAGKKPKGRAKIWSALMHQKSPRPSTSPSAATDLNSVAGGASDLVMPQTATSETSLHGTQPGRPSNYNPSFESVDPGSDSSHGFIRGPPYVDAAPLGPDMRQPPEQSNFKGFVASDAPPWARMASFRDSPLSHRSLFKTSPGSVMSASTFAEGDVPARNPHIFQSYSPQTGGAHISAMESGKP